MGVIEKSPGAKTVPRNHTNKNIASKTNENMQNLAIKSIEALEILDSRGNPTVQVEVVTERGIFRTSVSPIRGINRKF